ncbi:hypothetical protein AA313_de0207384 [Arthrobotrys entomopaga]|nr:hypothetical protein AA313_de0207384 [Arthrobotrys entomopaga]
MGQTLSEPVVEKLSEQGEDDRLYFGLSTMQGWRISMEDAHAAVLDLQPDDKTEKTTPETRVSFFGVYDGHGGDGVALFSGQNVHKIIAKQSDFPTGNYEKAMKDGFLACDRAILQGKALRSQICPSGYHHDLAYVLISNRSKILRGNIWVHRIDGDSDA